MQQHTKLKIQIQILICILWTTFLILNFELENQNQNLNLKMDKAFMINDIICHIDSKNDYESKLAINKTSSSILDEMSNPQNLNPFFDLTNQEKYILTCIVAGEAEGEDYEGKLAVAQCLLDSIVYENCDPIDIKWKFDGYNSKLEKTNPILWKECSDAITEIFDYGNRICNDLILWFYNRNIMYSTFHESQKFLFTIGNHSFFTLND